ncbi:FAD:protein FMN transferase [Wukongibacter baidiensis]|uniref:FAD:protein FMN transferase n=1 Tax=Wukongibacter baidiensis TaxID=1723361 RepID=UPI003D7F197B
MANKRKTIALLFMVMSVLLIVSACSSKIEEPKNEPVSKTEFVLGTVATIKIYDDVDTSVKEDVFNKVFSRLREVEDKMTINAESSEVISINSNAGKDFIKVSEDTLYVIKRGKYFSEISKGRFDISIGPLVKLWNIGTEEAKVPSKEEIEDKKALVDYNKVVLNEADSEVILKDEGMVLDLGGIAKGYGADAVVEILKENNIKHAIINLGGNVFAYGNKIDGTPWKVGVQNPKSSRGEYLGIAKVVNQTVVTSGIYERFFEEEGNRYHHILDTDTGYPVENNLTGVSIIADSSIDADSLSTAVFALGLEEGMKFIEEIDTADAVFVTKDSEVYVTSGLKEKFELTDSNFKLVE